MPNASYNVTLFFNDLYWDRPGQRLFNISANNKTIVSDFDIVAKAGKDCLVMTPFKLCHWPDDRPSQLSPCSKGLIQGARDVCCDGML